MTRVIHRSVTYQSAARFPIGVDLQYPPLC